jgi:hypothetical protein
LRLVVRKGLGLRLAQDRAARVAAGGTGGDPRKEARRNPNRLSLTSRRTAAIAIGLGLLLGGCGGSGGGASTGQATVAVPAPKTVKLPPGAEGPVDTAEEETEGAAATEASPEPRREVSRASESVKWS